MSSTTKIKFIETTEEFAACKEAWNELAGTRVFHRWEWMFSWWEAFQGLGQLAILVVTDESDRWLGVAPWYKSFSTSRGRVVQNLASGTACSDYVSLAIRPGYEDAVLDRMVEVMSGSSADSHPLNDVDLFEFDGHDGDDPLMVQLGQCLDRQLLHHESCEIGATWRAPLSDSWEAFEKRLHKSFRRKTKKASRRLQDSDFSTVIAVTPDAIRNTWQTFVDLHQMRRTSLGEPGCFADKRFESFLLNATLRLAEAGLAQINLVKFQGKPLTANLEFIAGDSVCMYQTGLDPTYLSLEPGHVNFTLAIQNSIERNFAWFDFLRGDEPYKSRWNAERVPLHRTSIVPRRWKSVVRHGIWAAGRNVKDWTKNVIGPIKS